VSPSPRSNRRVLGTLFLYEIKMLLRDTRTMLIAVVAPLVLFPALIFVMRFVEEREEERLEETTYAYAVTGEEAEWARSLVGRALALDTLEADTTRAPARFEEQEAQHPDSLLDAGKLDMVIHGWSARGWSRIQAERDSAEAAEDGESPGGSGGPAEGEVDRAASGADPPVPVLEVRFRSASDLSRTASQRLRGRLEELRAETRDSLFMARGLPVEPGEVARVEAENTASAEREGGALLGRAALPFLLFLMLSGGSIVAADAISGEKERGTLETLLTTGARRADIVRAKLLAVTAVGAAVAAVNILNLLVYVVLGVLELPPELAVAVSPLDLGLLLIFLLPVAVLVSSALLLVSGYAGSYKEYQIYFFPVFLVFLVPALAPLLPGIELRSAVAVVPVAGLGVGIREIMVGQYDWPFLLLALASTGGMAWWLTRVTEGFLGTERLIASTDVDEADLVGGPALFPRHVLRWFLGLWVVFFVVSLWFGQSLGLRGQILVNLVGIFFGGAVIMVWRYRLPLKEAFALRAPHPAAWVAVIIGAPAAFLLGIGVSELVNTWIFPVPERMLEAFGDVMLGQELPLWQLVVFLAVFPGVFEELAFRGVLVHGLRRTFRPWALALVVGLIFGLFHVSLFRIAPTAYLGVVLTVVVLLTGSIYPAMLWHALNNAVALVPARLGWVDAETGFPVWSYPLAGVALGAALGILWVTRRPYPGLKRSAPKELRRRAGAARS
jgi:sodium transport system permease protein